MAPQQWQKHVLAMEEANIHSEMAAPPGDVNTLAISKTTAFIMEQYRYGDAVKVEPGDVCLDLGACLGGTAIWVADGGAAAVPAFEMYPGDFQILEQNLARSCAGSCLTVKCGRRYGYRRGIRRNQ